MVLRILDVCVPVFCVVSGLVSLSSWLFLQFLTLCRQATFKDMIAIPCITNGSRTLTFSYLMSYTCVCQLVWLTYHFKVIGSLIQDVWVSHYKKQTTPDPLFLEPSDCNKQTTDCLTSFSCNHGFE